MTVYNVNVVWDAESRVWFTKSDDIQGLNLESGSFDALIERVKIAVPELMEINHETAPAYNLNFISTRAEKVFANG